MKGVSKWFGVSTFLLFTNFQTFAAFDLPSNDVMKTAVEGLLARLLHSRSKEFKVHISGFNIEQQDYFKVWSEGIEEKGVQVWCGTGVACALGIMTYLKYSCNASVSWEANNLSNLPHIWPKVSLETKLLERYRYYGNPCVFSYSYAFWTWERWEKEIDLMALMGINLALALEGQEALWRSLYLSLGLTEEEVQQHFTGSAFLAWGRMGNIERWGGPLSLEWQHEKLQLQKRIVTRMREFGMFTVLPAFSGHVPKGLLRVYPDANVTRLPSWSHFSEPYTRTYFLDPCDPLFKKIGESFIKKVINEFGSDHFYLVDPFNEMNPNSSHPRYLQTVSQSIYKTLSRVDPRAIWVTQGWMFFKDKDFWQEKQAKAYLTAVPMGKMLVLDLTAEVFPQFGRLQSYFGQPFIFCLLNNYGGARGMFGNVDMLLKNLDDARRFPNTSLVGTGMTPEGIGSNYVLFDLLSEMSWRTNLTNIQEWAQQYSIRRYGMEYESLTESWKLLMKSIFNCGELMRYHAWYSPLMNRPRLNPKVKKWYDLKELVRAWDLLISAAREKIKNNNKNENIQKKENNMILRHTQQVPPPLLPLQLTSHYRIINEVFMSEQDFNDSLTITTPNKKLKISKTENHIDLVHKPKVNVRDKTNGKTNYSTCSKNITRETVTKNNTIRNQKKIGLLQNQPFQHDIVEVTRELMEIAAFCLIKTLIKNYHRKDIVGIKRSSNELQRLISDMNLLLGSDSVYLLGRWIHSAEQWSNQTKEGILLRRNSLYQITLWGPNGEILDYAAKQWNGVLWKYVSPRWDLFSNSLIAAVEAGVEFDAAEFKRQVFEQVEEPFAKDLQTFFPTLPMGNPVKLGIMMHDHYRPIFNQCRYD